MAKPLLGFAFLPLSLCVSLAAVTPAQAALPVLQRVTAPQVNKLNMVPSLSPVGGVSSRRFRQIPFRPVVPAAVYQRLKTQARTNKNAPLVTHPIDETTLKPIASGTFFLNRLAGLSTPVAAVKFNGLGDLNGVEPPDMAIAVSPSFVVQGVNDSISVFSRTGAVQSGFPKSDVNFFHIPSPGSCDPVPFTSDPRAVYDLATNRFFVTVLQVDGPIIGTACAPLSKYWVAVSSTSSPLGAWHIYAFDMRGGTSNVADFTQTGIDSTGFYFSGNMFSGSGFFQYAEIFGVSKSALEAGSTVTAHGFSGTALGDTVQPAIERTQPTSGTVTEPVEFFAAANNFFCSTATCPGVTIWAMANGATASPTLTHATIATPALAFPPAGFQPIANFPIDTGDLRISGTPVFLNGIISYGQNAGFRNGVTNVPGVNWEQVRPTLSGTSVTGGTVVQGGHIVFSGSGSSYYPALTPDSRGNLYVTFGMSSISTNPSAMLSARLSTDALNTMEAPVVIQSGLNIYRGFRWGDYSAIALDSMLSTGQVWSATEFANSNTDWLTKIAAQRFP